MTNSKGELDRLNGLQDQLATTEEEKLDALKQKDQLEEEIRKLKVRVSHKVCCFIIIQSPSSQNLVS